MRYFTTVAWRPISTSSGGGGKPTTVPVVSR